MDTPYQTIEPEKVEIENLVLGDYKDENSLEEVEVSDRLVKSIDNVGIIEHPLVRDTGENLEIIDGSKRIKAKLKAGHETVKVLLVECNEREAREMCFERNYIDVFTKTVSDSDREESLEKYSEMQDEENPEHDIGIKSERELLSQKIGHVDGLGPKTIDNICIEYEDDIEELVEGNVDTLEDISGIGERISERITEELNREEPEVIIP